jgi:hypothetical protein
MSQSIFLLAWTVLLLLAVGTCVEAANAGPCLLRRGMQLLEETNPELQGRNGEYLGYL